MQIPGNPQQFIPGLLGQPQTGPGPQAKANARVAPAAAAAPARAGTSTALRLDEAVRTLRAEGRVPPRGSLLDIHA